MQFYLQSAVAEKGIDEEELRLEQADAIGGAIWTNVIADVHRRRRRRPRSTRRAARVTSAADAARGARAGRRASSPTLLFAVGLFGASVLAATIMPITHGLRDLRGVRLGVRRRQAVPRRAGVLRHLHVRAGRSGALIVLLPGLDLDPADRREPEPPGPAAADRARVHGPAGERQAADGPPPQRARHNVLAWSASGWSSRSISCCSRPRPRRLRRLGA